MNEIQQFLKIAQENNAADVHLIAGAQVLIRMKGELVPISVEALSPEDARRMSYSLMSSDEVARFEKELDFDKMVADPAGIRYRVNISFNDGHVGAVIRLLPLEPRPLADLGLPPTVSRFAQAEKGLVLITGATSQGKSTTMAAMVRFINENFRRHIVTIEDPIEYVHVRQKSIVRQRDVGHDTRSFATGLRAALRQDPDVIMIGEMRDFETIKTSLTAAETGVLVISSLHTISINKIVERLLSYAPDGGKRLACEVMVVNDAVRHILRSGDSFRLRNVLSTGTRFGMQTMKASLEKLLEEGSISQGIYERTLRSYNEL